MADFLACPQALAYAALPGGAFLRRSRYGRCLWLSDLPRRVEAAALSQTIVTLEAEGFRCSLHEGLLELDLSPARYEALLEPMPQAPPPFPREERYHPAYALCRLLLSRCPAPLAEQPLSPLREALKALSPPQQSGLNGRLTGLHERCALWLREGKPLPHAAGRVLAAWLTEQNDAPCPQEPA